MHRLMKWSAVWLYLLLWQLSCSAFVNGLDQSPPAVSSNDDQPQPSDTLSVDSQAFHLNSPDASFSKENLQSDNQAPQLNNQAPPLSNNQVPVSNNEIPQSNYQAPVSNNEIPQFNNQAPQFNNQASEVVNQASQANNQAPQQPQQYIGQAMNYQAQRPNELMPTNQPQGPLPTGSQALTPSDQIKPTHTVNTQWPSPAGNIRPPPVPPGGRAPPPPPPLGRAPVPPPPPPLGRAPVPPPPPPQGRVPVPPPPPPQGRAPVPPPPPPHPHPPVRHGTPSFLIPSSDPTNSFDGAEASFVFVLPSRHRQCFHHRSVKPFTFEFHVLHGGKHDIIAYVVGPDGRIIYESRDRRQGRYVASSIAAVKNATEGSDLPLYTVCLDNRFSTWSAKVVDFSIELFMSRHGGNKGNDDSASATPSVAAGPLSEEVTADLDRLNISWTQFVELTSAVEDNLHQTASFQRQLRSDETRDRMTMEDSASCVTNWSLLQLIAMIAVSTLQVIMIRALFDEKSLFHRVWKSKGVFFGRS